MTTTALAAPAPLRSTRMFDVDYVAARDFARRFGLTLTWITARKEIRLRSRTTVVELSVHSVEARLNGTRVFLSEPVAERAGQLYLSRGDIDALFTPLLSPSSVPRMQIRTIVIDAGHGGEDPGNQNRRLKLDEKVFTLDVARRLQRALVADGYRVLMTRNADRTLSLEQRAEFAARSDADLFISIHFNAYRSAHIRGTETYVMTPFRQQSTPQSERDGKMAATRFPANRFDRHNPLLGYQVHRELVRALGAPDRGLKRFRYSVLRSVSCPAVLVEAGFLSNDAEARKVVTAEYRQRVAAAVAAGVKRYASAVGPVRSSPKR